MKYVKLFSRQISYYLTVKCFTYFVFFSISEDIIKNSQEMKI